MERRRRSEGNQTLWQAAIPAAVVIISFYLGLNSCGTSEISTTRQQNLFQGGETPPSTQPANSQAIQDLQKFQTTQPTMVDVTIQGINFNCYEVTPNNPNAFRSIKIAGDPNIWEGPPYAHIPKGKNIYDARIVNDWDLISEVQFGDKVCVDP